MDSSKVLFELNTEKFNMFLQLLQKQTILPWYINCHGCRPHTEI